MTALDDLIKDVRRWKRQWCPTCTPYECVRSSALYYNHDLSEVAEDPRYIQYCAELDMPERPCGVTGCVKEATHTWSGHPTCDDCATPSHKARITYRGKLPFRGDTAPSE